MTGLGSALRKRLVLVLALVCTVAGVAGTLAVQASASGGGVKVANPAPVQAATTSMQRQSQRAALVHAVKAAPFVAATNAHCGETITAALTLNGDLDCTSGSIGLIIAGNSITVSLNGFSIDNFGNGSIGLLVKGSHDTVEKGNVNLWPTGVVIDLPDTSAHPVSDTITGIYAAADGNGFEDNGTTTTISSSVAILANRYGIVQDSAATGSIYKADHELDNAVIGLALYGTGATVTSNVANSNGEVQTNTVPIGTGIYVGQNAKLVTNTADDNWQIGIAATTATNSDGGGNKASGNGWATTEPGFTTQFPTSENLNQCAGVVCS